MKKIKHLMMKEKIANVLREEIINGNLKPNDKLNEIKLADKLDISRTPLREAIGILESEGFVETIPNRGSRVVNLEIEDIEKVYEIRLILEPIATRKSIDKFVNDDIKGLIDIQEDLKEAVQREDWSAVDILNGDFHQILYSKCENDRLLKIVKNLNLLSRIMQVSAFMVPGRAKEVLKEHDEIIEFIEKGKYEFAAEVLVKHITRGRDALILHLLHHEN